MDRTFVGIGAVLALLGVAAGAFGAHALQTRITPERLNTFEVAVRYQMYHALALIAVGWATTRWQAGAITTAGWLFVAGVLIFSGAVYALALGGPRWMGAVAPIGGMSLMAGWALLAWGVLRS
jgi:uncharacterized membrane protein YgdD (TMEM256/DUF423 family)